MSKFTRSPQLHHSGVYHGTGERNLFFADGKRGGDAQRMAVEKKPVGNYSLIQAVPYYFLYTLKRADVNTQPQSRLTDFPYFRVVQLPAEQIALMPGEANQISIQKDFKRCQSGAADTG
jgi:hypothetical protein